MFPGTSAQDITGQHRTALAGAAYAKPNLMVTTVYIYIAEPIKKQSQDFRSDTALYEHA
jgi:hypothetical protein